MTRRSVFICLVAVAVASFIIRNAFVAAYAQGDPGLAATLWPDHPKVLVSRALTDIGAAAVKRNPPPKVALADIAKSARLAPLSHDPFLVRGILAQQSGDLRNAERAFLAARQRAPREAAPRYFLSEMYLTSGRGSAGLRELADLARLLPTGSASVAPALAAYAKNSGATADFRSVLRKHPVLEHAVLAELAKDPANGTLAVRLATRLHAADGSAADWVKSLLRNLVQAGRYDQAYDLWARVSGEEEVQGIFDPSFGGSRAPAPFNWTLLSDSTGYAEPDGRGGLHVVYYGRDESTLASQTMLLTPGRYRLQASIAGDAGGMLRWTVACLPGRNQLLDKGLGAAARIMFVGEFSVGPGCGAQLLELRGTAAEMPREADITISGLAIAGAGNGR